MSKVLRNINLQTFFESIANKVMLKPNEDLQTLLQNDTWQAFIDKVHQIKENYDLYSIQLRKMFCDYYHDKFNQILSQYFRTIR